MASIVPARENDVVLSVNVITLRGNVLVIDQVVADLLAHGPAAASRWGLASPGITDQELQVIHDVAMQDDLALRRLAEAGGQVVRNAQSEPQRHARFPTTYERAAMILCLLLLVCGMGILTKV